jgi:hypothetical protein
MNLLLATSLTSLALARCSSDDGGATGSAGHGGMSSSGTGNTGGSPSGATGGASPTTGGAGAMGTTTGGAGAMGTTTGGAGGAAGMGGALPDGGSSPCTPVMGDDQCTRCLKERCCDEINACEADAPCAKLRHCLLACSGGIDESCINTCYLKYPDENGKYKPVNDCRFSSNKCLTSCP